MSLRVEPDFSKKLEAFGLVDNKVCFNCGSCTATCGLTEGELVFPRKAIHDVQLGLKQKLNASVEPWLCYYCGDCSTRCPRDANPGEQMMALRRYLTALYDWTGLSRKFYTSKIWELAALFAVGLFVVGLFVIYHVMNPGRIVWDLKDGYVHLNSFAPMEYVHFGDWVMAAVLSFFLLSNVFNMYRKIIRSDRKLKVPLALYIKHLWLLPAHFATQMRFSKCDDKKWGFWLMHFFFVTGYVAMFTLVMFLLPWFQIDKGVNWTSVPGYYAMVALSYGIIYCIVGRFVGKDEKHKYSHESDWIFLVMLFLTVSTGFLVHVFRFYLLLPAATYYIYAIHLAISVSMLIVEVPFSKWSHLAYRPVAIYLSEVRKEAMLDRKYEG